MLPSPPHSSVASGKHATCVVNSTLGVKLVQVQQRVLEQLVGSETHRIHYVNVLQQDV